MALGLSGELGLKQVRGLDHKHSCDLENTLIGSQKEGPVQCSHWGIVDGRGNKDSWGQDGSGYNFN